MTLKNKVHELAFSDTTLISLPPKKVKTKGALKSVKSTKCAPLMWDRVGETWWLVVWEHQVWLAKKSVAKSGQKKILYMNEFSLSVATVHVKVVDIRPNGNCGYKENATLLVIQVASIT